MTREFDDQANALIIQRRQTDEAQGCLNEAKQTLDDLETRGRAIQDGLEELLALAESAVAQGAVLPGGLPIDVEDVEIERSHLPLAPLDHVGIDGGDDWEAYFAKVEAYAARNDLTLSDDPFANLLSPSQRIALERRIREEFSLKNANCDKYDYMIAGTCGLIAGLVDVLFVGAPGDSALGNATDKLAEKARDKFANFMGFNEEGMSAAYAEYVKKRMEKGKEPLSYERYVAQRRTQFLENKFPVNYDQRHGADTGGRVKNMSSKNHHVKSMGHWPDLIGLFFSILDQFNSASHFLDNGSIISIDTTTCELRGSNFASKIFAGFVNWFGHLMSDMAGSNASAGKGNRGSGIPIPFFGLLQFLNFGEFRVKLGEKKEVKDTFAQIAVRVFEQGYDLRHGMALAIPVLVTELLIRVMWTFKQRFYHGLPWGECLPSANNPELRRMLLVGHGTLCIIDGADAAIRSKGYMIQFMLRANIIGWARFGTLALKELKAWCRAGGLDTEAVDQYLDAEYERLLAA